MTSDHISEIALIEVSRAQREAWNAMAVGNGVNTMKPDDIKIDETYIGGKNDVQRTVVGFGAHDGWIRWAPTHTRSLYGGFRSDNQHLTSREAFAKWAKRKLPNIKSIIARNALTGISQRFEKLLLNAKLIDCDVSDNDETTVIIVAEIDGQRRKFTFTVNERWS